MFMLAELSIRNFAVIEKVHIVFGQGFHVFTGETGAGKSIIVDALDLILGGRGSAELVRHGADKAEVEASFELPRDHPVWGALESRGIQFEADELFIVRREITAQGKSSGRMNGQLVNLSMMREIGEWLANIHGQHEHQSLLRVDQHLRLLDLYGGEPIDKIKRDYGLSFQAFASLRKQIADLQSRARQSAQMADLYRFQIDEIAAADLKPDEEEWLMDERRKLANAEKLFESISSAYDSVYGAQQGMDSVSAAMRSLEDAVAYDREPLEPLLEQMRSAFFQLEDAAFQLRDYREKIEFNPERLEQIEQRLNLISMLKRKYGGDIGQILNHLENIRGELSLAENKEETIRRLQQDAEREKKTMIRRAGELSAIRQRTAKRLSGQVEAELRELHMERTRFQIRFERSEHPDGVDVEGVPVRFAKDGWDQMEFMISANPGEPLRPLNKVASGGELSRIMLALKTIFAAVEQIPVLVFDEVDTGVSGRAAQGIADKLSKLSRDCQVFSITHLPQVACMADRHYSIEKKISGKRTFTEVRLLEGKERVRELARMLGGVEITETTEQHAMEMLELAARQKNAN